MPRPRALAAAAGAALVLALGGVAAVPAWRGQVLERLPSTWRIAISARRHGISVDHGVVIAMPDGVKLTASVYLPHRAAERVPAILIRHTYHRLKDPGGYAPALDFAANGYAVMVQDLRGTGDSGGEFLPWRDVASDGVATLDWIAAQPWSDGKVGTFGCSASGETQFPLARVRHPAHRAMIAGGAGGVAGSAANRYAYFGVFEGGVFQLASAFGWYVDHGPKDPRAPHAAAFDRASHLRKLPVRDLVRMARGAASGYEDYLSTPLGDPKWNEWGFLTSADRIEVPLLYIDTWGDQTVGDTLALAETWRRADPAVAARQRVVIAPAIHCRHRALGSGTDRFGDLEVRGGGRPWEAWYVAWFDHWLKGKPLAAAPRGAYHYFMLGEDRWLDAAQWPPAEVRIQRWHLGGSGRANTRSGDGALATAPQGAEATDTFRYDPLDPTPSRGGPVCCTGLESDRPGPAEQSEVENRDDVLVYTSAPLAEPLRIAGPVKARLTVSSSAPDTDLVARVAHVFPDGRSIAIQEGALRLRYRDGFTAPTMMRPGTRYAVDVDMRSIAYSIPRGHRLRLQVASSAFPRLERNLNTGAENNAAETRSTVAVNRIHHGGDAQAWLELALLP